MGQVLSFEEQEQAIPRCHGCILVGVHGLRVLEPGGSFSPAVYTFHFVEINHLHLARRKGVVVCLDSVPTAHCVLAGRKHGQ